MEFSDASVPLIGHDEMIEDLDSEQVPGLDEDLGDFEVICACFEIPGRMIMRQDEGCCVGKDGTFE